MTKHSLTVRVATMLRLDREFRRRGLRNYRGYEQRGQKITKLNFRDFAIEVGPFGGLRRVS